MKRYLLFIFETYYPSGGFLDYGGSFDTVEEAKSHVLNLKKDDPFLENVQIVDSETEEIIL